MTQFLRNSEGDWKIPGPTSLGGVLQSLGHTLMGVGVIPQLSEIHNNTLTCIAVVGFILSAIGSAITGMFAQDKPKPATVLVQKTYETIRHPDVR
jgi:hypothetical protein